MAAIQSLLLTALLVLGTPLAASAGTADEVEKLLAQAESVLAQARDAGNSWTTTETLIAAARQAEGEEAMELARRALLTAEQARKQQQSEQDAWQGRVPSS